MRLVTSEQMGAIDRRTQETIPGAVLMESAASAAWRAFADECLGDSGAPRVSRGAAGAHGASSRKIVFVAGSGNNGGDALVMARYCAVSGEHRPSVVLTSDKARGDAALQLKAVRKLGIPVHLWAENEEAASRAISDSDFVLDGLAGTGLAGPLRDPHATIVSRINEAAGFVVAIDTPSGVGDHVSRSPHAVLADLTLTLGLPKICLFMPRHRAFCGRIRTVPFTIPPDIIRSGAGQWELLDSGSLRGNQGRKPLLPPLPLDAHKGTRGIAAVFAGSIGTTGAAVLTSRAALAAGAGMVTLLADESVYVPLASQLSSVMVRPINLEQEIRFGEGDRFRTVVVGPGWGTDSGRHDRLTEIIRHFDNGVIDADAVTLLSAMQSPPDLSGWVLTPHPGELARLAGVQSADVLGDFSEVTLRVARDYGCIVVAKAVATFIADPDGRLAVVDGANPALATAGSGDVLAGLIGGLIARGIPGWDAARAGVLVHAEAGRRLATASGFFTASELPGEVGRVVGGAVAGAS